MWPFKRKKHPIEKMVDLMKAEREMHLNALARQVEEKLYAMPREEALKWIEQYKKASKNNGRRS